jgi:membrane-associated phospholipid phosphatase
VTLPLKPKAGFAVAFVLLLLVILLGLAVTADWGRNIDVAIGSAIGMSAGQTPDYIITFWRFVSWTGTGVQRYIFVTILALILGFWRRWQYGVGLAVASLMSVGASEYLKHAFHRARPELVPHLDIANNFAYPSGHATSSAVVYLLFALLVPAEKRGGWLFAAAILMALTGYARIALGVHWFSDVIGGWMLGSFFAIAMASVLGRVEGKS